ncbi:hypothetical protein D9613_010562 [Agrocybe pediades]|uniref:Uncharacterized protein n=1 Tax=Agrocybe pediades TaxID=84607 RepID=A0A8H4VHF7_9AGAR|nr:hypothetical protein D9613_010562 [Agrocybe pediades]
MLGNIAKRVSRVTVVPFQRPLIPFLKEPWSSKSKYPAILLETFLYGVYVVLFCCCSFILWRRRKLPGQWLLMLSTSLMFLLASADMIITAYFFFHFVLSTPTVNVGHSHSNTHEPWNRILEVKFGVYVIANAIASSLLINRCYEVWQNGRIILAPIALALIGSVISFISITKSQLGDKLLAASFIISAAANLSVTLLIATKMWWTSKKIRQIFTMQFSDMCDYVVCLILDSNAIYSLSIVLYLGFHTLVIDASLTQIAAVTLAAMILRKSSADSLANTSTYSSSTSIPQISPAMQRTRSVTRRRNRFRMAFSSNPFKRGSEGIEAK